jgi:LacI family transcriptional regulator
MTKKKRVTIHDVAREAGVSRQTVSRVLNDRPDVAPETRERVQEVIDQLGYRPSVIARSLSQGTSCSIGVVGYGLEFYGNSRVLSEIEVQANLKGYSLALTLIHEPKHIDAEQVIDELLARHVDGIVWAVPHINDNRDWLIHAKELLNIPVVCVSMQPHPDLSVVEVDNFLGGKMVGEHFSQQGYKNAGIITGPLDWWAAAQRFDGWKQALGDASLLVNPAWIYEGNWTARSGYEGGLHLLSESPELECIFACNDEMALGVMKAAGQLGLKIPDDFALIGYDNIPESEFFPVSLTTVSQGFHELGRLAMEELERRIKQIHNRETSSTNTLLISPKLIARDSAPKKK